MIRTIQKNRVYQRVRRFQRQLVQRAFDIAWSNSLVPQSGHSRNLLATLKNKYHGEPCVLIGGGPSINKMNLEEFKGMVSIACNGFYLKYDTSDFRPNFYTVEDPLPAQDNAREISGITDSIKIIPYDLRRYIKPAANTAYVNFKRHYADPDGDSFPQFSFDLESEAYWGGTVMFFNIQLAAYLGCNPIYLVGVDLNYDIPDDVEKDGAILKSSSDDPNHFDPRYFGAGKRWHLPETERMQKCFTYAYKTLERRSVRLLNAGFDSQLQVVPKVQVFSEVR